jgi:hypothetical protein
MVPSLEERRRRFRHLAETHPGLVVASALVDDVRANARAERRIALCGGMGIGSLIPEARIRLEKARPNSSSPFGLSPKGNAERGR